MTVHLQKLCVGCDSPEELRAWIDQRLADKRRRGLAAEQAHVTRSTPKRAAEVLDGGSLYWVIKGTILVRQKISDLRAVKDTDGVERCAIVMEPELVAVRPTPRRPFQGWRYLPANEAPADLADDQLLAPGLPGHLVAELRSLGLM
ncbi:DUF1489 domain-containing protein [Methylopila sp. M107]|uniref:DUF1489 family protein n=1 Tax=Methylopila sp. M107 TaxID=1101190 RepID=UPI00035D5A01|nr:DUF1489 domain-containing protein [Methylopila sp. M107]